VYFSFYLFISIFLFQHKYINSFSLLVSNYRCVLIKHNSNLKNFSFFFIVALVRVYIKIIFFSLGGGSVDLEKNMAEILNEVEFALILLIYIFLIISLQTILILFQYQIPMIIFLKN
jgi:O-antigen ligase